MGGAVGVDPTPTPTPGTHRRPVGDLDRTGSRIESADHGVAQKGDRVLVVPLVVGQSRAVCLYLAAEIFLGQRWSVVRGQRSALIIVTEPVPPALRYGLAHASPTGRHRRSRRRSAATQRRRPPVPRCSSAVPPLDGSRGMHTPDLPRLSRSHEAWSAERAPSHGPSSGVRDPQGGQGLAKSTGASVRSSTRNRLGHRYAQGGK